MGMKKNIENKIDGQSEHGEILIIGLVKENIVLQKDSAAQLKKTVFYWKN